MRAELDKKTFYLFLKQDYEYEQSYTHEFVEDCSYQSHLKNLGGNHPHGDECKHTEKDIDGARFFHYAVQVEQHHCYEGYVEDIFYTERFHFFLVSDCLAVYGEISELYGFHGLSDIVDAQNGRACKQGNGVYDSSAVECVIGGGVKGTEYHQLA